MSAAVLPGKRGWAKVLLGRAAAYDPDAGLAAAEAAGAWKAWRRTIADLAP